MATVSAVPVADWIREAHPRVVGSLGTEQASDVINRKNKWARTYVVCKDSEGNRSEVDVDPKTVRASTRRDKETVL